MVGGIVYLVGAGPGDPALITVRGLECVQRADVIVMDRLAAPALLRHARRDAETIDVGKQPGRHRMRQKEINALLVRLGQEGKTVVRLKGGDPFVFGRGGEEAEALAAAGVAFEVVPGISSTIAAPAYAGIPVTHRGVASSFAVVTGHEDPTKGESAIDFSKLACGVDTIVFAMGIGRLRSIASELMKYGRPGSTPVAIIGWGTTARQRVVTASLDSVADVAEERGVKPPAIFLVGGVAGLRETLQWFDNRPLFGKRIVVTRAREQAGELTALLAAQGAEPVPLPVIRITRPEDLGELDRAIGRLDSYDWIVFTSPNGVDALVQRLLELDEDVRAMGGASLAAIGPATAERLEARGLRVELVPEEFVSTSLAEALTGWGVDGKRVLLPRAKVAPPTLPDALQAAGAAVDVVPAYETVPDSEGAEEVRAALAAGEVDAITFTSSSTVRNFVGAMRAPTTGEAGDVQALTRDVLVACIGPVTAETAREEGLQVGLVGSPPITSFVEALAEHFGAESRG
ncbi:MAG: uroporphyrinogen-III C-methyltransferase [Armatimonadota bacterium]